MKIFTIGHSTRSLDEFIDVLKHYGINLVIDVRRFPSSKKFPWFNKEELEKSLAPAGIEYIHFEKLHGFREEGYENFSKTQEFKDAVSELIELVKNRTPQASAASDPQPRIPAIMCAEIVVYKCHRRYISRELAERGHEVVHIVDKEKIIEDKFASAGNPKIKCE